MKELKRVLPVENYPTDSRLILKGNDDPVQTLSARMGTGGDNVPLALEVYDEDGKESYNLRRLTPLECCRLQGFPDDWTEGIPGSVSAQYKMWGNGMALPCMLYVVQGISEALKEEQETLKSA